MSAEWTMVVITAIYACATIIITVSNIISAHASKRQLKESILQFDEMRRLSSFPFLQLELSGKKDCPVEYTFELPIDKEPPLDMFSEIGLLRNIGNGTAMNVIYSWECQGVESDGADCLSVNAIRYGESYKVELLTNKCKGDKEAKGKLTFEYQDLIGNEYEQAMYVSFLGYGISIDTDVPKLMCELRHFDK